MRACAPDITRLPPFFLDLFSAADFASSLVQPQCYFLSLFGYLSFFFPLFSSTRLLLVVARQSCLKDKNRQERQVVETQSAAKKKKRLVERARQ